MPPLQKQRMDARMNHYHQIIPLKARHPLLRLDAMPFIIIYTILIIIDNVNLNVSINANVNDYNENTTIMMMTMMNLQKWNTVLLFPLVLVTHLSLFLWTRWSVNVETSVGYYSSSSLQNDFHSWTHCLVIPPSPVSLDSKTKMKRKKNNNSTSSATATATASVSVGRREIVPVSLQIKSLQKKKTDKDNDFWIATISYEEIIFRCYIPNNDSTSTSEQINFGLGKDVEMDSIWGMEMDTGMQDGNGIISGNDSTTIDMAPKAVTIDRSSNDDDDNNNNHDPKNDKPKSTKATKSIFHRLHYPIDLPLSFYTDQWQGHSTKQSIRQALNVYSNNDLKINLPPFIDLVTQQLLAPFFLFQLFCVLLWCLDEYWYYALFTLFTLIMFECTVAYTRLKNLLRLRETLRVPFRVWVYRCNKWTLVSTNELIVGDVMSLSSSSSSTMAENHENGTHVPADLLLLKGNAVVNEAMLTGESVPQMKESIDVVASATGSTKSGEGDVLDIEDSNYKRAILFGGTVLVNHSSQSMIEDGEVDTKDAKKGQRSSSSSSAAAPDNGCVAMVLRTGFDTQQGSLLRTMVHTTTKAQSDGVNTKDTFLFILILLLCAVFSSAIVLKHGWEDPTRNRFKLILHVIIIITSVVPPELPMELSLAVTSSLADLIKRCAVYCTEPFRIPLAGMVDTCAFDKTGTLTSDEMVLRGVRLPITGSDGKLSISGSMIMPPNGKDDDDNDRDEEDETVPQNVIRVMVGCQSLASLSGYGTTPGRTSSDNLIGDPLEKAVLDGCGWSLVSNKMVAPPQALLSSPKSPGMISIQHRFAFTSKLKRMTVIATDLSNKKTFSLSKGAPETLKKLFDASSVPESYDSVSRYHMSLGQRVLAMGYKELGSKFTISSLKKRGREVAESNLIFAGFLVLDCPLKPDSRKVIKELRSTGHDVVMITGDAVLTAAEVARQVGIIDKSKKVETYELRQMTEQGSTAKFSFVPIGTIDQQTIDTEKQIAYSSSNLKVIKEMLIASEIAAVCVSGDVLTKLAMEAVRLNLMEDSYIDTKTVLLHPDAQKTLQRLVPLISVFARHAPRQKEAVIAAFNGAGRYTLMCGDGTNDVGALKMAHIGISIISVPDVEAKQRKAMSGLAKIRSEDKKGKKSKKKKKNSSKKSWEEHVKALAEAEEELNSVSLGDASVASPFTSRVTSIKCTKDVLQRGRCTLITMLQIYKILGVNCLVNALVLSSLHLVGAKQGDNQLTAVGLVVAGLFFFITKGQPLEKLSKQRPPSSILSVQALVSIAIQFAIHFVCIMAVTVMSMSFLDPKYDPSLVPDGAFNPNTLNTATFLITVQATVNTFVVNYRGRPFMEDLHENKVMMRGLQACYGVLFICALEIFPPINDLLQLTPLPSGFLSMTSGDALYDAGLHLQLLNSFQSSIGFKATLCSFMVLDTVVAYAAEKLLIKVFES